MAYKTEQIRNFVLCGHSGAGKTSTAEALLFNMNKINRLGRIADGTTVSDYDKDEIERQMSVKMSLLNGVWKDHQFNILDTPGYADFIAEAKGALRVADNAVVLVDAATGVEIGTERVWNFAAEYNVPRLIVINKLDREELDLDQILEVAQERFGRQVVPVQLPVNPGSGFNQIVDLVSMKLLTYADGKAQESEISGDLQDQAQTLHEQLVEAVAETDEELMEKYFGEGELSAEELNAGLHQAIVQQELFPVYYSDAFNNVGISTLMDGLITYLPSPAKAPGLLLQDSEGNEIALEGKADAPLSALVFKTLAEQHVGELTVMRLYSGSLKPGDEAVNPGKRANERIGQIYMLNGHERNELDAAKAGDIVALVKLKSTHTGDTLCAKGGGALPGIEFPEPLIRVAITPKEQGEEDRMSTGLSQLHGEDPSFTFAYDPEVHQSILSAQGELHLETIRGRLKERFGVEIDTESPRIPYRETVRGNAEGHHRHKKQSGGRGQFGEVFLRISPKERGEGFEFFNAVVGGSIPTNFIPAVEKGVIEVLPEGPVSGYQVIDVLVSVYDGKHHPVDSDEVSFKLAGAQAFKQAFLNAKPTLLEPIYNIDVTVPEEFMGDVMGDISGRRGQITGTNSEGHFQTIHAEVPLAEIDRYATTLRSISQGRGMHVQKFVRYQEVPGEIMTKISEAAEKKKEAA